MNLRLFVFALLPLTALAQVFTFGVQGGVPSQPPLGKTDKIPFVLGPTVNIRLSSALSLETGLLYHSIGRRRDNYAFLYPENGVTLGFADWRGSALELPFLARYRFLNERAGWRPVVSAGPTLRRTSITTDSTLSIISSGPLSTNAVSSFNTKTVRWNLDPSVGAGVDVRTGRFHMEPEVRYSYWGTGKNSEVRKNQVNVLFAFRF